MGGEEDEFDEQRPTSDEARLRPTRGDSCGNVGAMIMTSTRTVRVIPTYLYPYMFDL